MKRLAMVLILAFAPAAIAQPNKLVNKREQIKKRLRIMRANELTEELQLDESSATKLFPMLAKYDDELDRLLEKKIDIAHRLETASGGADNRATDKLIDEALANQKDLWSSEERRVAELRKILTPAQVAKVLVVLPALERKIQNQLRRAIENAAGSSDDEPRPDPPHPKKNRRAEPAPTPPPSTPPGCDPFGSRGPGCR